MVAMARRKLLQHAALHDNSRHHMATQGITWQHTVSHDSIMQHNADYGNTRQHMPTPSITLHHTASHCNTLAMHCNTLEHTETLYNRTIWMCSECLYACVHTHMDPRTLQPLSNTEKIQTTLLYLLHVKNCLPRQQHVPWMDRLIPLSLSPNANEPPSSTPNTNVYSQFLHSRWGTRLRSLIID